MIWTQQFRLRKVIGGAVELTEVESALRDLVLAGNPLSIRPLGRERSSRKTFAPVLTCLGGETGNWACPVMAGWRLSQQPQTLPSSGRR